jgi:hypothetical protein
LLETILSAGAGETYFFPQTRADTEHLSALPAFRKNTSKFTILNHDLTELYNLVASTSLNYIGNRLHGGIKCLSFNHPSIIVSVDNRASEMGRSINLNVIERNEISLLQKWIDNEYIPPQIALPLDNIKRWKSQFV